VKATLYHVQVNVADPGRSIPFYRDVFGALEYRVIMAEPDVLGVSDGASDIWIIATAPDHRTSPFHRKRTGINHLAFRVAARSDVDRFLAEFLQPRGIPVLYGGPQEYPEYAAGYYAVFFEDPDRLKLEVAYVPRRGASGRTCPRARTC
jgi:catechol 2,3-dioxygenase-like lactoylglutathione lyase family enzyme